MLVFLSLHTIAARWLCSAVPYDAWTAALFDVRLSEVFGWHRNHFDRLVHFTYGLCLAGILHRHLGWWRSLEVVIALTILGGVVMVVAQAINGRRGTATTSSTVDSSSSDTLRANR